MGVWMRPLVLSLLALCACTTKRTEVVIGVATNLDAPTQMSNVLMTVSRDGVPLVVQTWDLPGVPAGQFELPGAFGVYTDDGSEPRIEVELVGQLGTQDLIHRRAIFSLIKEQTLFMRLTLVDSCKSRSDCAADQTCVEGKCTAAEIDSRTFPAYVTDMEKTLSCSGSIVYKDTGTKQPMNVTGACAANETCSEGTCFKMPPSGGDGGVSPDGGTPDGGGGTAKFAYVANAANNEIRVFAVNAQTGDLTPAANPIVGLGIQPGQIMVDPSNQFLLVTNNSQGQLTSSRINTATGAFNTAGSAGVGTNPVSLAIHPGGSFVYVANLGSTNVSQVNLNASTGAVTFVGNTMVGTSPNWVAMDPTGNSLYVLNSGNANVSAFSINQQTGALTAVGSPVGTGGSPTQVVVDPSGMFVYAANSATGDVSVYTRNGSTGALTTLGMPVASGTGAKTIAFDSTGRFAYVGNNGALTISMFSVSAGSWTSLGTPLMLTAQPNFLALDPSGTHIYSCDQNAGIVQPLPINMSSGALSLGQGVASGSLPISITFLR
jgi:6-phosphogluconolactonase (cycloisomerase 2 family)